MKAREFYEKRKLEMIADRNAGMPLEDIGIKHKVTRERVRQIIGNTGKDFLRNWTKKKVAAGEHYFTHWSQLKQAPGVQRVWEEDWGKHRHQPLRGSVRVGYEFENRASVILLEHGIENKLMPLHHGYNIEASNGARIDVTVTHINVMKFETSQFCKYPTYSVTVRNRENWDFLFAFVPDPDEVYSYYVIPVTDLMHLAGDDPRIRIPHPPMSGYTSKFHKYHKRISSIAEFRK